MLKILLTALLMTTSFHLWAEDGAPAGPQIQYIYFEPAFVVNYGSSGRIKYLRTDVALRVSSTDAAAKVSHHRPFLRDRLVMLFSAQESVILNTTQGREELRQIALRELRAAMSQLESMPYIDDLFFNNFVVQN
ncbi:MAG: flagellar basal body-associated FliL family protein [Thalassolituus sp.]